jgi:mannose-1-phosphate guanylyltransferase
MNPNHYCVILAGGSGHMFWPASREDRPKEFLRIDGTPLLRLTYERFARIVPKENILVVTVSRYAEAARIMIPELPEENLLLEPYSRHTTPAMTYATYTIFRRNPKAVIVTTPSDHVILDEGKFETAILNALAHTEKEQVLMTLGIIPKSPSADYGYIQVKGGRHTATDKPLKVKTFTEKPSEELAKVFIRSGEFYWNSGIYIWSAATIRRELENLCPEVTSFFVGWEQNLGTPDEKAFIERAYADCPKVSLDYGILEKTAIAWLYPAEFGWFDIGSWDAYYANAPKDRHQNVIRAGKTLLSDARGNLLLEKEDRKFFAIKGLENYMVIDSGDVLLICPRDDKTFKDFIADIAMPGYEAFR